MSLRVSLAFLFPFLGRTNFDTAGDLLRLWPNDRDDQHAVPQCCSFDHNAVGQEEAPLKLPCGDAPVQELALSVFLLPPAHHQLVILGDDIELGFSKSCDCNRNQEPFGA